MGGLTLCGAWTAATAVAGLAAEPTKFLGETIGFWVQTGAFIISAIAAVWIIYANYLSERRRSTIEVAKDLVHDREMAEPRKVIRNLHEAAKGNFARYLDNHDSVEYQAIMKILNNYEFIANGIRTGAFDEKILKRVQYSMLVRDWGALCPFIVELRNQNNIKTLFQEFEWLSKRWINKPLKKD